VYFSYGSKTLDMTLVELGEKFEGDSADRWVRSYPFFLLSISSSLVNLRLHTGNHLNMLPGIALTVCVVVVGGC
jgi:hypothetical protein